MTGRTANPSSLRLCSFRQESNTRHCPHYILLFIDSGASSMEVEQPFETRQFEIHIVLHPDIVVLWNDSKSAGKICFMAGNYVESEMYQ